MMKEADFNETSVHIYQNTVFIIALYYKYGRQFFYSRLFIIRCTEFSYRLYFILLLLDPSHLSIAVSNEFD